ncbi:YdcF family protein [Loigolactobacillus zhaoyuanensis]|uniref:YdcF family protein n=2 Tax=Loigolactobacillus zhaoyuanensis TaxID=2486017 RepID=A0ABW8UF53_9LACO|nr:YdcF family protein [Loigolactobacillus zhaoyuanensis]
MWWLVGLSILVLVAYWRRLFWLAGYGAVFGGGILGWYLLTAGGGLNLIQRVLPWGYGVVSGLLVIVGYLFWYFARQLLRRRGERLAYRSLQLVALILVLLPVLTLWWRSRLVALLWLSVGYFAVGLLAYAVGTLLLLSYPKPAQPQYVIVLGSGLRPDGQLTSTLYWRVRRAAQLYRRLGGHIIVSGGQGSDEPCSEAEAMAAVLIKMGVPASALILEDRSTSTLENLQLSLAMVPVTAVAGVLTSNFHILRAALYANRLDRQLTYYAAYTPWRYLPIGALRDYLALLVMTRWRQLAGWLLLMLLEIWL